MSELPPMPDPVAEEPELKPGGPDAIEDDPDGLGLPRDLAPENNPAVEEEKIPDEITQIDESKDQEPSGEADSQEEGKDAEAGQVDEEGNPEPPA